MKPDFDVERFMERHEAHDCSFYKEWDRMGVRGQACAYCGAAAVQTDHFIKKAQARRMIRAAQERENPKFKAPSCRRCNEAVYTRNRVPVGFDHLIPELEAITGGVYATWNGTPEGLREVIR